MEIIELNISHSEIWNEFVSNHPNGNIFQTSYYFELHLNINNFSPFALGVFIDGNIVGIIAGVIQSNFIFPIRVLTKRAIIIGGPLIQNNDESLLEIILDELNKKIKQNTIFTQFRNLWNNDNFNNVFSKHGYLYEPHLDIINDLTQDEEDIRQKVSKNKRGNIRKSRNKGTTFQEINEINEFTIAVELVIETYKNIGLPCPDKEYFSKAFRLLYPLGILKMFAAYYENEVIGVRIELCYRGMIYDWYTGSNDKHNNKYPNDFLPYNILLWGKQNNYKIFDFGGAGKPNIPYGVRDHKLKFGGELLEFGRFEKINNTFIYKVGKFGLSFMKAINKY